MLNLIDAGDPKAAEELLPLVYDELRRLAAAKMATQPPGQTLQATALVHEAWLKVAGNEERHWNNRRHFYFTAAEAMRQILIDRARRKRRVRHGAGLQRVDVEPPEIAAPVPPDDEMLQALDEAIDELDRNDPLKARIVKLKFFIGLTDKEVAEQVELSDRQVKRHWAYARAWLFARVDNGPKRKTRGG